jgi:hypothetical protein
MVSLNVYNSGSGEEKLKGNGKNKCARRMTEDDKKTAKKQQKMHKK